MRSREFAQGLRCVRKRGVRDAMGRRDKRPPRPQVPPTLATAKRRKSCTWPLAVLLPVLVATVGVYVFQTTAPVQTTPPPQLQAVQREFLANRSYREIGELRRPLVLSGIVVDRWQARSSFTSSFLAQKLTHVMAHRQESSRSFMTFHDNKPLESLVNERWEDFNVKVNVTLPEVLNWHNVDHNLSSGPYLYFSQDIATLRNKTCTMGKAWNQDIMDHVQPIDDLILSPDNVQVNLWIGRAGIVTHTHYDCTFNFFVQLHGRKRFTLSPPDSPMYLYPCLHPHYGHSQVDILTPNPTTFPHFSMDDSRVAEVGPGDMLVVPPFWFHHVETLEESVSVNVWSDAPEYALINQIYEQPIPFEENWGWRVMATATKIYTEMLLQSLEVTDSCQFIGKLIEQRYEPVVSSGNLNISDIAKEEVQPFCSSVQWETEKSWLVPILSRGIRLLQPLFVRIATRATLEICLGNYVEHLLHLTVGLDYVYPFLKNCFTVT